MFERLTGNIDLGKTFVTGIHNMENSTIHKSDKFNKLLRDGYDFPVYGIANGSFIYVHVSAITFIIVSLVCAVIANNTVRKKNLYELLYSMD